VKNLGTIDRLLRVILAELFILVAFFWVGTEWQIPLYLIAMLLLFQAATSTCGFYNLLGWNSCELVKRKRKNKNFAVAAVAAILVLGVAGIYASIALTNTIFLEDLGKVKEPYSLALQFSGQGQRQEAMEQYDQLRSALGAFQEKYSNYRPWVIRFDGNFTDEMNNISATISGAKEDVYQGNLTLAQEEMQKAEHLLQKMQRG
jgi:hypothetical protein